MAKKKNTKVIVTKGGLEWTAQWIVDSLQKCVNMAEEYLPSEGHDDREALLTSLNKALTTAKNVLRVESHDGKSV